MNKTVSLIVGFLIGAILSVQCHAAVLLFDNFEQNISKTGTGADAFKKANGGQWDDVKAINTTAYGSGCAYIYTVSSIPGFTGTFPGRNSSRVAVYENLPYTNDCYVGEWSGCPGNRWLQTDAFLFYGQDTTGYIPANTWIQFWVYLNSSGSQVSQFRTGKFLYTCGDYGAGSCDTGHMDWMGVFSNENSYAPDCALDVGTYSSFYYAIDTQYIASGGAQYTSEGCGGTTDTLGYNQSVSSPKFSTNAWYLVKMNYNMTNASAPVFRMWVRKRNESSWTLYAEWIGGTTSGLTWTAKYTSGMKWLKLFDTVNCYDSWVYFDDFVIAEAESDLPVYFADTVDGKTPTTGSKHQGVTGIIKKDGVYVPLP